MGLGVTWTPGSPILSLCLIFPSRNGPLPSLGAPWLWEARAWLNQLDNFPVQLRKMRHRAKLGLGLDHTTESKRKSQDLKPLVSRPKWQATPTVIFFPDTSVGRSLATRAGDRLWWPKPHYLCDREQASFPPGTPVCKSRGVESNGEPIPPKLG